MPSTERRLEAISVECELAELSEQFHSECVERLIHDLGHGSMQRARLDEPLLGLNVSTLPRVQPRRMLKSIKPQFCELWRVGRRAVFILGNSVRSDGTIWTADRKTGERLDVQVELLKRSRAKLVEGELFKASEAWAREGVSDAAWWQGSVYSGTNHPKSVWYLIAAIRMNPDAHGWALDRVLSDARSAIMCGGVPKPCCEFLRNIAEFRGVISVDWKSAVKSAEQAVHVPAKP